jgi:hypothetical protein
MLKPAILALIRQIFTVVGTALVAKGYVQGLCCTNRVTGGLPLSPDRLILRLQLRVCRAR